MKARVKRRGANIARTARALSDMRKPVMTEVIANWRRTMLPVHFTERAKSLYGYATRTLGYTRRKRKELGHINPLVWSGTTRDDALLGGYNIEVTNTTKNIQRTKLKFRVPRYMWVISRFGNNIDKISELLTTADSEIDLMHRNIKTGLDVAIAQTDRETSTERIV